MLLIQSIPREDVLVIPSGRLRRNATAVLAQVFEFLNLSLGTMRMPDNWEGSEPAGESVAQVVKKSFPSKSNVFHSRHMDWVALRWLVVDACCWCQLRLRSALCCFESGKSIFFGTPHLPLTSP